MPFQNLEDFSIGAYLCQSFLGGYPNGRIQRIGRQAEEFLGFLAQLLQFKKNFAGRVDTDQPFITSQPGSALVIAHHLAQLLDAPLEEQPPTGVQASEALFLSHPNLTGSGLQVDVFNAGSFPQVQDLQDTGGLITGEQQLSGGQPQE